MGFLEQVLPALHANDAELTRADASPDGLVYLGGGTSRTVFRITTGTYEGCVLKFAKKGCERRNIEEYGVWREANRRGLAQYFCPIRYYDTERNQIVMEYADTDAAGQAEADQIMEALRQDHDLEPLDIDAENVGLYNGGPVLVDYPWVF